MKQLKLLLIDDDPFAYLFIREQLGLLSDTRCEIDWRDNLSDGARLLREQRHDVYLIDYRLGDQDGLDLLRELQYLDRDLAAILLTSAHSHELYLRSLELGACGYLAKQEITPSLLERSIRQAIRYARALDALRATEARYQAVADSAEVGVWEWDLHLQCATFSARWKALLGHQVQDLGDGIREWFDRVHPEERDGLVQELRNHMDGRSPAFRREHRLRCADGGYRWFLSQGVAMSRWRIAGTMADIHDRKQAEEQIRYNATHDTLTGLPNRAFFMESLTARFETFRQDREAGFAVMFIDLDGFKLVNDSMGHLLGDQLLETIAERLRQQCVDDFRVARIGGDEFALLMPGVVDEQTALTHAQRVNRALCQPVQLAGRELHLGASIGIALSEPRYARAEDLLRDADLAMYHAKAQAEAPAIALFHPRLYAAITERLRLENDLRRALETDGFHLHYQPIYALERQEIVGVEALLRWQHPERGWISPAEFVPFAEESGLIIPLGEWVLAEACRQLAAWSEALPMARHLTMSVNLSPRQFVSPHLPDTVNRHLRQAGLNPERLKLEITENALLPDAEEVHRQLTRLRDMGINCQIDDFGTGYSSLSYLHQLPGTGLKIDQSFVRGLTCCNKQAAIIQTVLTLGRQLGMEVIAEGVETEQQAQLLRDMGCQFIQGYWYARPMPADQLLDRLREQSATEVLPVSRRSAA